MKYEIDSQQLEQLEERAKIIRRHIVRMITKANSGHPGGSLSAADLVTCLYFHAMQHLDPSNPQCPDRDRFVLCKGHAAPVLYATLAERGFISVDELDSLRQLNSRLQGHPDMKHIPGVDMSTGSLGQGLSAANGMALAARVDQRSYHVYALLGDGELEEGQVWEAAMAAAHYKLDNVTAIIDHNGLQIDGCVSSVMNPLPIGEKFRAFGWNVMTIDGHHIPQIIDALTEARTVKNKPTAIVARTVKGKGVCMMENQVDWHGKAPSAEQCQQALCELE